MHNEDCVNFGPAMQSVSNEVFGGGQGFGGGGHVRQRYAMTERDDASGLDHTWFRKNENRAGRWTSPDPYNGSMSLGNPQSFNRYSYVENQPTNFVDPRGLNAASPGTTYGGILWTMWYGNNIDGWRLVRQWFEAYPGSGGEGAGGGSGNGSSSPQDKISEDCKKAVKALGEDIWNKVQELMKAPPLFDIDSMLSLFGPGASLRIGSGNLFSSSMSEDLGRFWFGDYANPGETVGETFDRSEANGGTGAWTVRGFGVIDGIYYRGTSTSFTNNVHFLLHEVVHLAFPVMLSGRVELDTTLVEALGIVRDNGQSHSAAVSRFFNSGCNPKFGGVAP